MLQRFDDIEQKYEQTEAELASPEIISDQTKFRELMQKHKELKLIVEKYREYKKVSKHLAEAKVVLAESGTDKEMQEMAQAEVEDAENTSQKLENELKMLLVPTDPNDRNNAILEIRQGTGGEEAALFAANLLEMYRRYAENNGWQFNTISVSSADQGGVKEAIVEIAGDGVYGKMKYESGTHRVQRVPKTEASGRVHTSAATVAIMPEVEEVDIQLEAKDLRIDTFRASGAGGQHVNKTDSAIRITHIPTGTAVACQDGRSQHQNRETAMRLLKSRIFEQLETERLKKEKDLRKMQVGSGDRSEKIRTYNYPQNRVTDHRIGYTSYSLEKVMIGELAEFTEALITADRLAKLQNAGTK